MDIFMGADGVRRRDVGGGRIGAGSSVFLAGGPCVPSSLPAVRRQKVGSLSRPYRRRPVARTAPESCPLIVGSVFEEKAV